MAKYAMSDSGRMYGPEMRALHMSMTTVIVLPEADWRRLVEMIGEFPRDGYGAKWDGTEIDGIIQRTEQSNA